MTPGTVPPRFLSFEFHTRFFPALLRDRYLAKKPESTGVTFVSTMDGLIVLAVCGVLLAIGLPSAIDRGALFGWILSGIGGLGILFILFLSAGLVAGAVMGRSVHFPGDGVAGSVAGLIAGYLLGVQAGLRMQHPGWIAGVLNMLAGLMAIGVLVVAFVLLFDY